MKRVIVVALLVAITASIELGAQAARGTARGAARGTAATSPVVVFETSKGVFEVEFYPNEAPKSVEHILTLVRRNFYNGLRVHRFEPGFVIQFGDPQTRDVTKEAYWGSGGSGRAIGIGEISPKRTHKLGAVALASTAGDPRTADSQLYICVNSDPGRYSYMNGKYAVIGQVISGMSVVQELRKPDVIKRASVKEPGRGAK